MSPTDANERILHPPNAQEPAFDGARSSPESSNAVDHSESPPPEGVALLAHNLALDAIQVVYPLGTALGTLTLLVCGGFVPVLRRWLADDLSLSDFHAVVATLGGAWPRIDSSHPDSDLGPVITPLDASGLCAEVTDISRRMGTRPPAEIRVTYLPCCAVMASGRRKRALVVGLPLLSVLTRSELRAVLAHELAHWAKDDAGRTARATRFVDGLARVLEADSGPQKRRVSWSPLNLWARACLSLSRHWLAPIARGLETRADRASAALAGGDAAASALVKVAFVQPVFREVLAYYSPEQDGAPNVFAYFRTFWHRLPESVITSLRHGVLSDRRAPVDPAHPALLDRMVSLQNHAGRPVNHCEPATTVVGDLEGLEQKLHDWLFTSSRLDHSVFHRAGT